MVWFLLLGSGSWFLNLKLGTPAAVDLFSSREMKVDPRVDVALGCVNLFSHNVDRDHVNSIVLGSLPGTVHTFAAKDTGSKGKQVLTLFWLGGGKFAPPP